MITRRFKLLGLALFAAVLAVGVTPALAADTQMAHGAPYEVFLSADANRPKKAEDEGLAVPGTRYTYAFGRLVLYSKTPDLVDDKGAVLASDRFAKLAIADPAAAPYGLAAVQTMRKLKVYDPLTPRIVRGASIGQAYQYV